MAESRARVTASRRVAADTLEVVLEPLTPGKFTFRPGQFLSIACGNDGAGKAQRRSYSMASAATVTDRATLLVKVVAGGVGSAYISALRPGSEIGFTGPMGFFVPELAHHGDVVFAITGAGMAPVVPMLCDILSRPETGRVVLHWGCRHEDDLFYRAWLDELAGRTRLEVTLRLSQPGPDWTGARGRITQAVVTEAAPGRIFYIVGSGDMVRDVTSGLVGAGMDRKRQLRSEIFYPASKPA
jgi:ferredoxin-NADP reductase